jgi:alpha-tubulin suppressor-like RCC1 family protein
MTACGSLHALAVTETGAVYAWGAGDDAQLGLGFRRPQALPAPVSLGGARALSVAAGCLHSVVCTSDGALWTCGDGANGRLGHGDTRSQLSPAPIPLSAFGGALVKMAACGAEHVLVITAGGGLWAFGCGHDGQLGVGDRDDRLVPAACDLGSSSAAFVAAGEAHSVRTHRASVCVALPR